MKITHYFLFICLILSCDVLGQTNSAFKINPEDVTLASDKAIKWYAWGKVPDGIKAASKYISPGDFKTLFELCEAWSMCQVQIAALDLNDNGIFGLAVSIIGKGCCSDNKCMLQVFDDGGKFTIWRQYVEGNVTPAKNGVITNNGKFFQFVINENLKFSEERNVKANQSMKYFVYKENVEVPVVLRATPEEILAAKVYNDSLANIIMKEMAEKSSSAEKKPSINESISNAGEVASNAKVIDANKIHMFRNGSALIEKGTAYALINDKAAFIIPFNTYTSIDFKTNGVSEDLTSFTGIYRAYNSKLGDFGFSFINSVGKTIYKQSLNAVFNDEYFGTDEGFGSVRIGILGIGFTKEVHFNAQGTIIQFPDLAYAKWNEGIAVYRDDKHPGYNGTNKMGFKNSKGQIIISPQFDDASVFSEGLAAVAKRNEFGELKWGYIDTKGKIVIPYEYSKRPGDFGNGLASITPVVVENFSFAYINKKGEIVLKIPVGSNMNAAKFQNGYAFSGDSKYLNNTFTYVLDTTGKIFKSTELLSLFNLPTTYLIQTQPFYNHQMFFAKGYDKKKGILDLSTKKYIPAIFDELSMFDPTSNLAYAKLFLRYDDKNRRNIYREGYINKDGVFVIIKGEPNKF